MHAVPVIHPDDQAARRRFPEAETSDYVPRGYVVLITEQEIMQGIEDVLQIPARSLRQAG